MTEQDVNQQHLAAMGLADTPLGQAFEQATQEEQRTRCDSVNQTDGQWQFQCARQAGHEGRHARAGVFWEPQPEPLTEVFTVSCDYARSLVVHKPHVYSVGEIEHTCPGYGDMFSSVEEIEDALDEVWPQGPAPTKTREGDQPLPTGGQQCVQDLVIAKMEESKRVGLERYGSTLQTFNGRRGIQDVAEEARDLMVYLAAIEAEAEADRETLADVVFHALSRHHVATATAFAATDPTLRGQAEVAVDAIMGWVVGQRAGGQA